MEPNNQILLDSEFGLESFDVLEENLIENDRSYDYFLTKTKASFYKMLAEYSNAIDCRPYQYKYAALMCVRKDNIMAYEMSVGKTLISLLGICGLYKDYIDVLRTGSIQISVPNLLSAQRWVEDGEKLAELRGRITVIRTEKELLANTSPIIIYTHDFIKHRARSIKGKRAFISRLLPKPNLLLIDECHAIKNHTERTKHFIYLRNKARRVLALSGTLSDGNVTDIYNICKFVYQRSFPFESTRGFSSFFGTQGKIETSYLVRDDVKNNDKFIRKLEPNKLPSYYHLMRRFIHRVKLSEPDVAKFIRIPVSNVVLHKVEPTQHQKDLYNTYTETYKEEIKKIAAMADNVISRAQALRLLNPLIEVANSPEGTTTTNKLEKVLDIINNASGKVVIFCSHIKSARIVTNYLSYLITGVVRLYSSDPTLTPPTLKAEERLDIVSRFQFDPNVTVGVFSINLAGESIDLTNASDLIHYCLPWSSVKIQQANSRCVRSGNKNKIVNLHYIYQHNMIDEHQTMLAVEKIKSSKLLMDYDMENLDADNAELSPNELIKRLLGGN